MIPSFLKNRFLLPGMEHFPRKNSPRTKFRNSKLKTSRRNFFGNEDMASRLEKTLYYGELPKTDAISLNLTAIAVKVFSQLELEKSFESINCDYVSRLSHNACVNPCSVVMAFLYVDRLHRINSEYLHSISSSKLFLVSVMVASKFLYDDGEDEEVRNEEWAASVGIDTDDMNKLEREFLNAINWSVFVNSSEFHDLLSKVESYIALQETMKRGWLTYTDFDCLSSWLIQTCSSGLDSFIKNSFAIMTLYSAYVLTVLLSASLFLECNRLCFALINSYSVPRPHAGDVFKSGFATPDIDLVNNSIVDDDLFPEKLSLMPIKSWTDGNIESLNNSLYNPPSIRACHESVLFCSHHSNYHGRSRAEPPFWGTISA